MSTSMYVEGIRPADEKHKKMTAAYYALQDANLSIPEEIKKYFDYGHPSENGVRFTIPKTAIREGSEDVTMWMEVSLKEIPKDCTHLRFSVSF